MFTFNPQENDNVATVFNGDYQRQVSSGQWETVGNYEPFTVSQLVHDCTFYLITNLLSFYIQ